jgi:putative membrane protein
MSPLADIRVLDTLGLRDLAHLLLTGASVLIVAKLLPGVKVKSYATAVLFAIAVAIANTLLFHWLGARSSAAAALSTGLGALLANALAFWAAGKLVPGVELSGCITSLLAAAGVTFLNGLTYAALAR